MNEGDLQRFEARRYRAMLASNTDELSHLLHERLLYTHSNGQVDTKQTFMSRFLLGQVTYHTIIVESFRVEKLNDTFLQWASFCSQVTVESALIEVRSQFMSVVVQTPAALQLLSYQATPLATFRSDNAMQPWFRG